MNEKEAKALLESVKDLDEKVNSIIDKLEFYTAKSIKITATYNAICVQEGGTSDKVAECAVTIADIKYELGLEWDAYIDRRDYIESLIDKVDKPEQRYLLKARFLYYKEWEEIRQSLNDFFNSDNTGEYVRGALFNKSLSNFANSLQEFTKVE